MEVAVGRSGGEPVTERRSRVRLNAALYAAVLLCVALVGFLAVKMWHDHADKGGDTSGGWFSRTVAVVTDDRAEVDTMAGTSVGRGVVQAVPAASEEEQERVAAQIEAASKMVTAFVNFSYQDADATIEAVRSMSTGTFLQQYSKGATDLKRIATQAKSEMDAEVVWAGLVAGDDDSATVIVATSGTVKNQTTKFQPEARNYRIQVELVREDDRWLTRDLQYVALG